MGTYVRPTDVREALEALESRPLTILAGGTDFFPARVGRPLDDDVLDISGIGDLRGIHQTGDQFRIGATTTWTDILRAPLPPAFDGLKLAAREVGGVQIQNAGTVCGNICNASPAADGVPPLLTLDARVELASRDETRSLPLSEFITGNRATLRQPNELVVGLVVPKPGPTARGSFLKLGARTYLIISIVMVAGVIESAPDRTVAAARLSVGAAAAAAQRLPDLETALVGHPLTPDLADVATDTHLAPLAPIDDIRGPAAYRREAALTLIRRMLRSLGSEA